MVTKKIEFWRDKEKGLVDHNLFSTVAEEQALTMEAAGRKMGKDGSPQRNKKGEYIYEKNRSSQLRKFYDEVQRLNTMVQINSTKMEHILPMLHMLTAKAAYAEGRNLVSQSFREFIRDSVMQIHEPTDLRIFADFFEAFMGFYKLHGPKG